MTNNGDLVKVVGDFYMHLPDFHPGFYAAFSTDVDMKKSFLKSILLAPLDPKDAQICIPLKQQFDLVSGNLKASRIGPYDKFENSIKHTVNAELDTGTLIELLLPAPPKVDKMAEEKKDLS